MREEEHKARDKDELKDELKGKRVWRIGGIGVWSYSLEEEVERNKMEVWKSWGEKHGRGEWVEGAKERTRVYNKGEWALSIHSIQVDVSSECGGWLDGESETRSIFTWCILTSRIKRYQTPHHVEVCGEGIRPAA